MAVNGSYPNEMKGSGAGVQSTSEIRVWTPSNKSPPPVPTSPSAFVHPPSPLSEIDIEPAPVSPDRPVVKSSTSDRYVNPPRPKPPERRTTLETAYVEMLLSQDKISRWHNICAHFFTWILLAGYLVFPATFTNLTDKISDTNAIGTKILNALGTFKNGPWLYVAASACGVGVLGMTWLWARHRKNYVWVINRIFLPGFTNALAGLLSTLVNVYAAQHGQYSVTAKATTIVTGACSVVLAFLFLLYNFWALSRVKAKHRLEIKQAMLQGREKEGEHGSVMHTVMQKVQHLDEQGFDPLSIV